MPIDEREREKKVTTPTANINHFKRNRSQLGDAICVEFDANYIAAFRCSSIKVYTSSFKRDEISTFYAIEIQFYRNRVSDFQLRVCCSGGKLNGKLIVQRDIATATISFQV